jgi:hypothetical protein
MRCNRLFVLVWPAFAACVLAAASRDHIIHFGAATQVQWFVGTQEESALKLKVRPLYVDGKLKEFTTGQPRDITDRAFVVRKVYRVNDRLPSDAKQAPAWKWQRAGWLLVDRPTGRVTELRLPEFDPFYSTASWYRDYVAYCGISGDAEKLYAVVAQVGVKKPLVHKELGPAHGGEMPDSECDAPAWQRSPVRVTIAPKDGPPVTFAIHRQNAEASPEQGSEE